jgi:hypothetical protein
MKKAKRPDRVNGSIETFSHCSRGITLSVSRRRELDHDSRASELAARDCDSNERNKIASPFQVGIDPSSPTKLA